MKAKLGLMIAIIAVLIIVIVGIGINSTGLFSLQNTNNTNTEPIKIGVIAPLTGGPAQWGLGAVNMIKLATDEVNLKGGINGRKVELIIEDGKCDPKEAVNAANKLINVDKVHLIFGGHCSAETAALAPVLNSNKVIGMAGVSTATGVFDNTQFMFRTSPPNFSQAKVIAKIAFEKYNIHKVAMITENATYSKSISNDFEENFKALGGEIVASEEFNTTQGEAKTELLKLNSTNANALFVSPQSPTNSIMLMRTINELGIKKKLIGNTVFVNPAVTKAGVFMPEDTFTANMAVDLNNSKMKTLLDKFIPLYGEIPYDTFFVSAVYDGAQMVFEAINACGGDENTSCLREHLLNVKDWQGASAAFNFDLQGDPILNNWKEIHLINGKAVFTDSNN